MWERPPRQCGKGEAKPLRHDPEQLVILSEEFAERSERNSQSKSLP